MKYSIYVADCETTGLDYVKHDVIEASFIRLETGEQKTWRIAPVNTQDIDTNALRINGHKLEDLLHKTKYGVDTYLDPAKSIVDIENWLLEDNFSSENRILLGQNIAFDKSMLEGLWKKQNSSDTFPFGRRLLDTMIIEFFLDFCKDKFADSYSLSTLTKKYGVKNNKAHSAEADTKATHELFMKQVSVFKEYIDKK